MEYMYNTSYMFNVTYTRFNIIVYKYESENQNCRHD